MKRWLLILTILFTRNICAQNEEIDLEQFAERLFQLQDENIDYEDIYESLLLLYTSKLNLNKATQQDLENFYVLNPAQIQNFFAHIETFGKLLSIHELQSIPGFDLNTVRMLLPFVSVQESEIDDRTLFRRILEEENNYFLLRYTQRLERQKGYTAALPLDTLLIRDTEGTVIDTTTNAPSRYLGSPSKIYGRFRTSRRDDFSLGFTFEKDAGERFSFDEDQLGFDFYSWHLLFENKLGFEKIILGDYQLQVGQGIIFGAGFNPGKGAETVNTSKRATVGLRPYTSILESGFFRGIGLTKKVRNFEFTGFFSATPRTANVRIDSSDFSLIFSEGSQSLSTLTSDPSQLFEQEFANSIINSGLHRTQSELERRNSIREVSLGGVATFQPDRRLLLGVSALQSKFSVPLGRSPNNYNQFEFRGDFNRVASVFANYTWQNFAFFGEAARSSSGGIGAIGGFMSSLSAIVDLALIFRNYDKDFHSFYGNAFSENTRNINERGTYWGVSIKPNRKQRLNFYYDRFRFPWLRFRTEAPSVGNEWLIRYSHYPSRKITMYAQVRQQTRQVTLPAENLSVLTDQQRYNYLFNIDYSLLAGLQLKTRVQGSRQAQGDQRTNGFAIIQDVNFQLWKLRFHTRTALFETDDFANAQYAFENDVLYAFSIPAYNGSGIRNYIMVRYNISGNLSCWIRYARTTFPGIDPNFGEVGSSLENAAGNVSSEIKAMIRFKF
ncbi:MAG: helix-hairpin-helix domain-containing protein [Bacteroidota bacterium]